MLKWLYKVDVKKMFNSNLKIDKGISNSAKDAQVWAKQKKSINLILDSYYFLLMELKTNKT